MPIDALNQAIANHAWAAVAGCVLLILVSIARNPLAAAQWSRIPSLYRPFVPVALGILFGVGEALSTKQPWLPALITNVLAAVPALLVAIPSPTADIAPKD